MLKFDMTGEAERGSLDAVLAYGQAPSVWLAPVEERAMLAFYGTMCFEKNLFIVNSSEKTMYFTNRWF
ncbi:MAG: hypothetical protein VYA17_02110 [Pseudomonadota bacterium]|nr:hypothetical protein [Pseudomonadota bacterium]